MMTLVLFAAFYAAGYFIIIEKTNWPKAALNFIGVYLMGASLYLSWYLEFKYAW